MMNEFLRWLNLEKGIFLSAALAMLVVGYTYQRVPTTRQWGAPRCDEPAPEVNPVSLEAPPPLPGFLAGGRGSPFSESDRIELRARRSLPAVSPPPPPPRKPKPKVATPMKPPPPPPKKETRPPEKIPAKKPKPYDLPVNLVGRVKVGDVDSRTVFVVKEDGRYVAVREGQDLPGLGVRLVRATKSIVIVENEKGQRFRLDDLLRARAAAEEAAGGDGGDGNGGGAPGVQ